MIRAYFPLLRGEARFSFSTWKDLRPLVRWLGVVALWWWLCAVTAAQPQAQAVSPIDSLGEWWRRADDPARREEIQPLALEVRVVYADPRWNVVWVQCGKEMGYLPTTARAMGLVAGQQVRLTGTVNLGAGVDSKQARVEVIANESLPEPLVVDDLSDVESLSTYAFVKLRGYLVQRRQNDDNHIEYDLVSGNLQIRVIVWVPAGAEKPDLLNSHVQLMGCLSATKWSNGVLTDRVLWVGHPSWLQVDENRKQLTEGLPIFSGSKAVLDEPEAWARLQGVLTEGGSNQVLLLETNQGPVSVKAAPQNAAVAGRQVEVLARRSPPGASTPFHKGIVVATEEAKRVENGTPKHPLQFVRQVRELSYERLLSRPFARLTGVVTHFDAKKRLLYLEDLTGGVRVSFDPATTGDLAVGSSMLLEGQVSIHKNTVTVEASDLRPGVKLNFPAPRETTIAEARLGRTQSHWVRMSGVFVEATEGPRGPTLKLGTPNGNFYVRLSQREPQFLPPRFGAWITVTGVALVETDADLPEGTVCLMAPASQYFVVERNGPADPFAGVRHSLADYETLRTRVAPGELVTVEGVVLASYPNSGYIIGDGTRVLRLLDDERSAWTLGDQIEAVGLPGTQGQRPVLRFVRSARVPVTMTVLPRAVHAKDLRDPSNRYQLVEVEGVLDAVRRDAGDSIYMLRSGEHYFEAVLPGSSGAAPSFEIKPGSTLRIRGLPQTSSEDDRRSSGALVLMRSAEDLSVLRPAPWFNSRFLSLALGGVVALALAIVLWAATLRHRVRKQTEIIEEQMRRETLFTMTHREILANVQDFIFTLDLDGRFISYNAAGERLTGYTAEEAKAISIYDLVDDWSKRRVRIVLDRLKAKFGFKVFEAEIVRRDGSKIWVETNAGFVQTPDGSLLGLGVMRDISARKRLEEEMKRARATAENNTRAKSAFLATMSHELRTPMNGVIGMTDLLLQTELDDEQSDYAQTIRTSAVSLVSLLNDLLDFSRIEGGSFRIDRVAFDLQSVVDNSLTILAPLATAKHLELTMIVDPSVPHALVGDPGRFRQILINLTSNGLKFTERGGVQISVGVASREETRVTLRVAVKDTGVGIPEAERHKLFQPFSQVDADHSRKHGGAGLGLAICRHILGHMGGDIDFVSEIGQGTTFTFTACFDIDPAKAAVSPGLPPPVLVYALGASEYSARFLAHYGQRFGVPVSLHSTVIDLAQAMEAHPRGEFPAFILIDDVDVCDSAIVKAQALRARFAEADAVIGLLGWMDARPERAVLRDLGVNQVITKPLTVTEMNSALSRVRNRHRATTRAPFLAREARPLPPALPEVRRTVLIAEDNLVNQKIVCLQLARLGFDSEVVTNGAQVVPALRRRPFDFILMDCQMPEMDGLEASRRVREHAEFAHIPIIALTANALPEDRERCFAAGMNGYLTKPLRAEDLKSVMSQLAQSLTTAPI